MPDHSASSNPVASSGAADGVALEFAPFEPESSAALVAGTDPSPVGPLPPNAEDLRFAEAPPSSESARSADFDPDIVLFEKVSTTDRDTPSLRKRTVPAIGPRTPGAPTAAAGKNRPARGATPATPAAPAWFGGRKAAPPSIVVAEEQPLTWSEQLRGYVFGRGGAAYVVSTTLHVLLLLILAWIVFDPPGPSGPLGLVGTFDEESLDGDGGELDTVLADDGGAESDPTLPVVMENVFDELDTASLEPVAPSTPRPSSGAGDGPDTGDVQDPTGGTGHGLPFARPGSGGKTVTKGSFTVWTVPEDPRPGEQYLIVVEVRIPEKFHNLKTFPVRDLSGFVIGTDGYQQRFPSRLAPLHLPISGGVTQFAIPVPGAERLVEDTIDVRSINIVRESQRLKIVF